MEQDRLRDRFRGAMLGVAVGDALGAPFEGMGMVSSADLKRLEAEPGPLRYTDDTHTVSYTHLTLPTKRIV